MSTSQDTAASLLWMEEQLRQERETFDQRKKQSERWFTLQLMLGYIAGFFLPAVLIFCVYIFMNYKEFSNTVVVFAGSALLLDIVGFLISVGKIVLRDRLATRLEPIRSRGDALPKN